MLWALWAVAVRVPVASAVGLDSSAAEVATWNELDPTPVEVPSQMPIIPDGAVMSGSPPSPKKPIRKTLARVVVTHGAVIWPLVESICPAGALTGALVSEDASRTHRAEAIDGVQAVETSRAAWRLCLLAVLAA